MTLEIANHTEVTSDQMTITLAVLQDCNMGELENAIDIANQSQDAFKFVLYPDIIHFKEDKYKFASGSFNLMKATHDLVQKRPSLRKLLSQNLVFITSYPDSDQYYFNEYKGKSLSDELSQCLFYELEPYSFGQIRLVSTYIWDHLPPTDITSIPISPSGRRALQPYLLLMFASVALDQLIEIPYHEETRGCPFDYCNNVREIDRSFQVKSLCDDCDRFIKDKVRDKALTKDQYLSFIGLINRTYGNPSRFKWDVAISFAGSEREIAKKLADSVIKAGFKPFFDDYSPSDMWGENLSKYLNNVYSKSSRYCVIL